ncbi:hypothetical protein EGI22_22365 [Lacihabitans sp. LS3-19]|uniref:hypothetical protein n=1 Tax=Lacihabitans sp. LS3-19 TaxID=2487335 RepID=UPI0020CC5DD2|nr:hypothetical protein [Lacihabitans sp. LS3-19]MCP9770660.1 hypothetical protein [Lacihabitans sp. LS3-19]
MKNLFFILILLNSINASACDICGCGNGSSFFGILPQSHYKFGGIRFQNKTFESHASLPLLKTEENFQSIEPWLRLYPFPKTQLMILAPFQYGTQTVVSTNKQTKINGMGDVSAIMHYNIKNTFFDSTAHKLDQIWLIGGGIKLPTGKFDYTSDKSTVDNPNFQAGTGSLDFIINSIYTIRKNNWGFNTDLTYKINTTNKNQYKYANKSRLILNVFNQIAAKDFTFLPNAGVLSEYAKYDSEKGIKNNLTGGYMVNLMVGSEIYYKKITAGFSFQKPMKQNLSGGELKLTNSFMGHVTLLF